MATVGFSTHTALGGAQATQFSFSNVPTIVNTVKQGNDLYSWKFDCVNGNDSASGASNYMRIATRAASGVAAELSLATCYTQWWDRFETLPDSEVAIAMMSGDDGTSSTQILGLKTDGKLTIYDTDAVSSGTATATSAAAISTATWYRFRWSLEIATGNWEVKVYNEAGDEVVTASGTGAALGGADDIDSFYLGHNYNSWTGMGGTPNFLRYVGSCVVDGAAYPHADIRVGMLKAAAEGTHTDWTANTGTKVAAVQPPPNGNTSYITSTTADAAQTFTMDQCDDVGIHGTICCFSPFWIGWDMVGVVTMSVRLIENSTTTDTTLNDPAAQVDFHLRGALYTAMPSDSSIPTVAKLNAIEVGVLRDSSATTALRVGTIGCHIVYIPGTMTLQLLGDSYISSGAGAGVEENYGADDVVRIRATVGGTNTNRMCQKWGGFSSIPANATIVTSVVAPNASAITVSSAQPIECARMLDNFVEGTGTVSVPTTDGITWTTEDGAETFTTPGGDLGTARDAVGNSPTSTGVQSWSNPLVLAEIRTAGGDTHSILFKRTTELTTASNVAFDTKDNGTAPTWTITYTVPDEASSGGISGASYRYLLLRNSKKRR